MTVYKVRRGEQVHDVEGFAALVKLAQDGHLRPDDAVFVPASNRWHYARSIRQLREYFPLVEDPPPPPGKVREMPREMAPPQPPPSASHRDADDGTEATHVGEGAGADVVPLRRGRWTPDGKGVEVPIFNYEIDVEPPAGARPLRLVLSIAFALLVGGGIYLYGTGYAEYLQDVSERIPKDDRVAPTPTPPPIASDPDGAAQADAAGGPGAAATPAEPEETRVAVATPTPVPLPDFDAAGSRSKVLEAKLTAVRRPDQLGAAMRSDLIKLAVPVRSIRLAAAKKARRKGPVPFDLTIDYSAGDDLATATRARHYWMIGAMAGRRANELRLNLRTVTIRTWKGEKRISQATMSAADVKAVSAGTATPDSFLERFSDLRKKP